MAYTAYTLITKAYYLSGIVARDLQIPSGSQVTDGLELLNDLLDIKPSDLRLIPYFKRDSFPTIVGVEEYYRPNLLYVDAITFNLGSARYPIRIVSRKDYFATARVDGINSLPFTCRIERELGGSRIYLYFSPSQVFTVKLSGKFSLTEVSLYEDLSLVYDRYYIEYLRYALAEYICSDYGATFPDESKAKYEEIRKKLMDISPPDLTIRKSTYFSDNQWGIDWQTVNLSEGYWP